ncbi:hypothetical protein CGRAC_1306 [Campylobacter gracilis]|nr:hypothetical protein CGRAC_1306 [Campylobacter gracilis]
MFGKNFYRVGFGSINSIECYYERGKDEILNRAFQFPTGWNSTISLYALKCAPVVFQFPTGWNSTQAKATGVQTRSGFNSQRDGILPYPFHLDRAAVAQFQFPTG